MDVVEQLVTHERIPRRLHRGALALAQPDVADVRHQVAEGLRRQRLAPPADDPALRPVLLDLGERHRGADALEELDNQRPLNRVGELADRDALAAPDVVLAGVAERADAVRLAVAGVGVHAPQGAL